MQQCGVFVRLLNDQEIGKRAHPVQVAVRVRTLLNNFTADSVFAQKNEDTNLFEEKK